MRILLVSVLVLALALVSGSLRAGDRSPATVYCMPALSGAPPTVLQQEALAGVEDCLKGLGVSCVPAADDYILLVDACEQGDRVALSLTMSHALPPEAIEAGAKAEVMYAGMPAATRGAMPVEGKFVREQASADFLRQFWMPLETKMVIVGKGGLAAALREAVTAWHKKFLSGEARPH